MEGERDLPFNYGLTVSNDTELTAISNQLGIKSHLKRMATQDAVLNAIRASYCGRCVSYSRRMEHYTFARQFAPWATYAHNVPAIDRLDAAGWIDHHRQTPGSFSHWQSSFTAKPELRDLCRNIGKIQKSTKNVVVLRDPYGKPLKLNYTQRLRALRRDICAQNEAINAVEIGFEGISHRNAVYDPVRHVVIFRDLPMGSEDYSCYTGGYGFTGHL